MAAFFNALGKCNFFPNIPQKLYTADFFKVEADRIIGIDILEVIGRLDLLLKHLCQLFFVRLFGGMRFFRVADAGVEQCLVDLIQLVDVVFRLRNEGKDIVVGDQRFLPAKV